MKAIVQDEYRPGLENARHLAPAERLRQLQALGAGLYACGPSLSHFRVDPDRIAFDGVIVSEYLTVMDDRRVGVGVEERLDEAFSAEAARHPVFRLLDDTGPRSMRVDYLGVIDTKVIRRRTGGVRVPAGAHEHGPDAGRDDRVTTSLPPPINRLIGRALTDDAGLQRGNGGR